MLWNFARMYNIYNVYLCAFILRNPKKSLILRDEL
jgi:hypothetical protein